MQPLARRASVRLVFAGTPEPAAVALRALLATQHDVVAVVTRPDAKSGRGRMLRPSPVAELAAAHGIEVLKPASARDGDFQDRLRELAPQCCPVVAYGGLIPQAALDIPERGWVNLHFSLLPAWRGAAPVQHALIAGDEVTGASVFELEAGLDTGPIYGVMTERVREDDTAGTLLGRLAAGGADLLVAALDGIASGDLTPIRQSPVGVSLAPKLDVADGRIDWRQSAVAIDRRIRGCTPAPGAWTTLGSDRLKLGPVTIAEGDPVPAGEVIVTKHEVIVGTGTDPIRLGQVGPPGKQPMAAADWARGARFAAGQLLGEQL
jgi:methionyl-tRNA formyltransferase